MFFIHLKRRLKKFGGNLKRGMGEGGVEMFVHRRIHARVHFFVDIRLASQAVAITGP